MWFSAAACQARSPGEGTPEATPTAPAAQAGAGPAATSSPPPIATEVPPTYTPTPTLTPEPTLPPLPNAGAGVAPCSLPTVIPPTLPATIPGYTELDPATGLHITGQYQEIDPAAYRLKVNGQVDFPRSFTLDELRCLPRIQAKCTLICPGYFEDYPTFAGVPLAYVLKLAGIRPDAQEVEMVGADGYRASVDPTTALELQNFLAYEWRGEPLPVLHGFPVRAVFPSLQGSKWVKWLVEIVVN